MPVSHRALACTAIYIGSDLTADGSTLFARSEDISNSYSFTTFSDDNGSGVDGACPDCGGTHKHTPYGAAGTNEMGVTVTATETIGGSDAVYEIDPYEDLGIEEAEIPTILLSEAATAREALDLLLGIYDTAGCCGGSGLFIADNTETWYAENVTGHQYVALKLNGSLAFTVPNISVISLIDLDGTENVIASEGIISVAKEASTYVGDEEANTIDYVASYNADQTANSRMVDALKYFNAETATDEPANDAYTISNVDAEGNIVPLYTGIALDHAYSVEDIVGFYDISGIGSSRNLETHIFQIFAEDGPTDTVEWVAMNNASMSAFVPYYPMLTTDTYAGYQLSTAEAVFTEEEPAGAEVYYERATNKARNCFARCSFLVLGVHIAAACVRTETCRPQQRRCFCERRSKAEDHTAAASRSELCADRR